MHKRTLLVGTAVVATTAALLTVSPASAGSGINGTATTGLYLPGVAVGDAERPVTLCTDSEDPDTCEKVPLFLSAAGNALELVVSYANTSGTPDVSTLAGVPLPAAAGASCAGKIGVLLTVLMQSSNRSATVTVKHNGQPVVNETVTPPSGSPTTVRPCLAY